MKICDIKNLDAKEYVVLLPKCDYDIRESVEYSFKNVFYLDYETTKDDAQMLIDFINNEANQLILFDYDDFYRLILPYIRKNKKVKWIYKNNCASLTDGCVRTTFSSIMEFYDRNIVDEIGCLDYGTYKVLQNAEYNVRHIRLDIDRRYSVKKMASNSIGLIGNDYNPNHNIYNQLSALKLVDYDCLKMIRCMPATEHFINFFDIKEEFVNTLDEAMSNNCVNLYCNFTFTNNELVLKSLDKAVPCILGNTDIFDDYENLKKYLVLNSDDDIGEIADKINLVRDKREEILLEYEKFRDDYKKASVKSIEDFLGVENHLEKIIRVNDVIVDDNDVVVKYSVSDSLKKFFFTENDLNIHYYSSIKGVPKSVAVIPFLTLVLPVSWITGAKVVLDEIDDDFYNSIDDVRVSMSNMLPQCNFIGNNIICNKIVKNNQKKQTKFSTFYSGGVDSLSTLISVKEKKPYMATIWGSDVWLTDHDGWQKAVEINDEIALQFELSNFYIKSNFRNVIQELILNEYYSGLINDNWWHAIEHGIGLLGHMAPLVYTYKIGTHYIPATYSSRDKNVICASYPTIDEALKFCGCNIIHEGFEKNRQDKLHHICEFRKELDTNLKIRACYMQRGDKTNCCECEKCYRTIMGIVAEKQNPRDYGFDISDEEIGTIKDNLKNELEKNKKAICLWKNVQDRCYENKEYISKNENYKWILDFDFE